MFRYLVSSATRRKLLQVLWTEGRTGSVRELAEAAGVAFAGAYREVQAMARVGLVRATAVGAHRVFAANREHPDADLLLRLLAPSRPADDPEGDAVRAELRALGAPLSVEASALPAEPEAAVTAGLATARRDPTVARTLPVVLWTQRDRLRPLELARGARRHGEKMALGFFLELTSELSGDPRFRRWARDLVDRRVRRSHDFFVGAAPSRSSRAAAARRTPALARRWGFEMNADLESFRATFDRFVPRG